jgi:hypothetical protein
MMTTVNNERTTADLIRAAVSGWLGTALEFMDFQLYSLGAALVFHEIFFLSNQPQWRLFWRWGPMARDILRE